MGVGADLYMYNIVVKKFTFDISSSDEFLVLMHTLSISRATISPAAGSYQ